MTDKPISEEHAQAIAENLMLRAEVAKIRAKLLENNAALLKGKTAVDASLLRVLCL